MMQHNTQTSSSRVFISKILRTSVFDPVGDNLGHVHDVVLLMRFSGPPRVIGLVVDVGSRRRVFMPITRVTGIKPGAVITTGLVNIRRFSQRSAETIAQGQLFDRIVSLKDGSGQARILDMAMEQDPKHDWLITQLYVQRIKAPGRFRAGETFLVPPQQVSGLLTSTIPQDATQLLATMEDLKAPDLADVLHDLPDSRLIEVATQLPDERLADVLEELGEDDQISILTSMDVKRAADVLDVMQPDDAADLVSELPEGKAKELLELMEPEEAEDVRLLMRYDEHTAGGLMTTEPVILPPDANVATLLASVRRVDIPPALAATVFVVRPPLESPTGRYIGMVHIQRALREPPQTLVGTLVDTDVEALSPNDGIGKVTRLLATYNLTSLPVVDEVGRLLGAISVDDVLDNLLPADWRDADDEVTDETMDRSVTHE